MNNSTENYTRFPFDTNATTLVSHAGASLLTETMDLVGLSHGLQPLNKYTPELATHRGAKILTDVTTMIALGGDCPSDINLMRTTTGVHSVFGAVASAPTEARFIHQLTDTAPVTAVTAFNHAVKKARTTAWALAGKRSPMHQVTDRNPLTIDLDATVIVSHSEDKEGAKGTWKGSYGHHPLCAFLDYGSTGTGEPLAFIQRPGNAGSNTASDHIKLTSMAINQLPTDHPRGRKILVRVDTAGCTYEYLRWLTAAGRGYQFSVTYAEDPHTKTAVEQLPQSAWNVARDDHGRKQSQRHTAEITLLMGDALAGYPAGSRLFVRREPLHPGSRQARRQERNQATLFTPQLPGTYRYTFFLTNQKHPDIALLDQRHRARARCEDRIRNAKDTGLRNLPYAQWEKNEWWMRLSFLASTVIAWMQLLCFDGHQAVRWEPKKLRASLFAIAAKAVRHARRTRISFDAAAHQTPLLGLALGKIRELNHAVKGRPESILKT